MQPVIGPNDVVTFDDEQWEIESLVNNIFGLRNIATDSKLSMSLTALSRRIDSPPIFDRSLAEISNLGINNPAEQKRIADWAGRCQEILYGKPDEATDYRPGYAPELTTQGERLELMVRQLNDAGIKVGKRSVERYVANYKAHGDPGLLDKRTTRNHHPLAGIHEDVLSCIDAMIADRMYKASTPYLTQAVQVTLRVKEQFPVRDFVIPGTDRLIAAIKEKTKGLDLSGSSRNRRGNSNVPDWVFHGMEAILPGSEVQVDSSRYDVRARKPDGTIGSFTLTVMMDKCTRSILALSVQPTGQGAAHAYLLAQAMTPSEARPGSDQLFNPWVLKNRRLPWAALLDDEEAAKWDTRRPVVRIFRIMTDNGRDFTSRVFDAACRQLGIIITRSGIRSPTDKAMIENFFQTLLNEFIAYLPGSTGGSESKRGEKPDEEDVLDIEDLIILLDRWVVQFWQNRPHEGLRDPLHPSAKPISPNVMYASMFPFIGYVPLVLAEEDYISLQPADHRTIQKDGIEFHKRQYDSEELADLRMHSSGNGKLGKDGGEWEIHYRPTDPRQIWVYVPAEDRYITCFLKENRFDNPHLAGYWRIAKEMMENGYVIPEPQAAEISGQFIKDEVARIRREEKQLERAELAEHLAEMQGMGGPATRTTLTGSDKGSGGDADWDNVEEYPMSPFIVERKDGAEDEP